MGMNARNMYDPLLFLCPNNDIKPQNNQNSKFTTSCLQNTHTQAHTYKTI